MKIDTQYLVAGIAAVVVVLGGLAYWMFGASSSTPNEQVAAEINSGVCKPIETVAITPDDFIFGKADAPVTIVEYASQTCSHCADFRREVFPKLEENYIKTGKVRFVFREFQRNKIDLAASVLGRCLGRDAFIPFTDMLFENQQTWMMREDQDIIAGLRDMTRRAGMSNADFDACMQKKSDPNAGEALAKRLSDARDKAMKDYCLEATPTLILNGKKLGTEGSSYESLDALLSAELKKLGKAAPAAATTETPAAAAGAPKPADGTAPDNAATPAPAAATTPAPAAATTPPPAAATTPATKPADAPKPSKPATETKPNP